MKHLVILLLLLSSISSFAQDFHNEITRVYNFSPQKMTADEQKAVFPALDSLFAKVMKDKDKYLVPLRDELRRNDNSPYFYYDGGILLYEISKDSADIQLVADALVKSDIRDLSTDIYLEHLLRLSKKGANVVDAALHILDDTTFKAFFATHSLTLKYGEGLKFLLPRYSPDLYIDKLIERYKSISSVDLRITCLDLFVYANCCKADAFIDSLYKDPAQPARIHDELTNTINLTTVPRVNNEMEYTKVFEERKTRLNRISDEAGYELNDITLKMRKNFDCSK